MKIAIILCAFIGASVASPVLEVNYGKTVNTGRSQVMRKDDGHGNYEFGYDEEHAHGGSSRREKGGKGWQTGSYELRDKDGRKRTVKYVADAHGFRAQVDTNEPGVDAKEDPADVQINKNGYGLQLTQPISTYVVKTEPIQTIQPITYIKSAPIQTYETYETGKSWPSAYESSWSGPSIETSYSKNLW